MSEIGPEMVVSVPKGWLCPVCGRVYAPFMPMWQKEQEART